MSLMALCKPLLLDHKDRQIRGVATPSAVVSLVDQPRQVARHDRATHLGVESLATPSPRRAEERSSEERAAALEICLETIGQTFSVHQRMT